MWHLSSSSPVAVGNPTGNPTVSVVQQPCARQLGCSAAPVTTAMSASQKQHQYTAAQNNTQYSTVPSVISPPTAQHIPSLDPTACTTEIHSQNRTHKAPPTTVPAAHMHKEQLYYVIITAHAWARHEPLHPVQPYFSQVDFQTRPHKARDTQAGV